MTPETERPLLVLRDKIEASYPNPIATAFRRYCAWSVDDLTGRQKFLHDLFELFVKYLCAVQLSEGHGYVPNFSQRLSKGQHTLDFLSSNPSLGKWVGLLRELCELDLKGAKPNWSKKISDWYNQADIEGGDVAVEQLSSRFNLAETKGRPAVAIICNSLVRPRNVFAHQPMATEQERKATLFTLESVFAFVFESASFLGDGELFICRPTINIEDGGFRFSASVLRGSNERDQEFHHGELLQPDWVYLTQQIDRELAQPVVPLTPFLLWQRGNEEKREQMFVLDRFEKNRMFFSSFVTGKPHEERNSKLRDVLTNLTSPSFQADFDDSPYNSLPASVRSNIANTLYSQGLRLLDYRYFEQAFKFLRDAAAAEKRPEILASMASAMVELKEPINEIRETLQQALELDPTNTEARHLIGNLTEDGLNGHPDGSGLGEPLRKTVFHVLCPRKLRNHAITFWFSVIVVWYSVSAITEFISGNPQRAVAMSLAMLCCLAVVLGAAILRPWAERLKKPLQRQLGEMRKERFNEWFDDQLRMIFESFSIHDSKSRKEERNLRVLYAIGIVWMISMVGGAIYFSESYKAPFPLMLKRLVDYFVLFGVLYPAVQYTTAITLFVYHVSGIPLRPTLTKLTNDGMRHLGPFVAFNIIFSTLIYSLLHLSFAIGFTNPMRIDLLFLFVGTSIVAIWTIAFPFQLRRSLQASKNSSIVRYSGHVDEAFNQFVEEPSERNEGRYRRLIDNERIIQNISVWPLTAAESLFVIGGSNLLLIMVATAYVIHRLGLWTELAGWFK